jgi:hypothetical protein
MDSFSVLLPEPAYLRLVKQDFCNWPPFPALAMFKRAPPNVEIPIVPVLMVNEFEQPWVGPRIEGAIQ